MGNAYIINRRVSGLRHPKDRSVREARALEALQGSSNVCMMARGILILKGSGALGVGFRV